MDGHSIYSADHDAAKDAIAHLMDATDAVCANVRYSAEELRILNRATPRIAHHVQELSEDER